MIRRFHVILSFLFLPALLWSQTGLNYLAEYMNYMKAPPLGLYSYEEERVLLLYPRGYLDLAPGLKADEKTLLSLWHSEEETWPVIQQGQVDMNTLFLMDQNTGLHRLDLDTGMWQKLPSLGQSSQRLIFLDEDRLISFQEKYWRYYRLAEEWQEEAGPPGLSPLTLGLGPVGRLYLMDPLQGVMVDPDGITLKMETSPGNSVMRGQILGEKLHLWSVFEHLEYSLDGKLLGRESTQAGMQNLLWFIPEGLLRYNQPAETLYLDENPFSFSEEDWLIFLKREIPPLLERENRDFIAWTLNLLEQTYLKNPLDSELGQLKKQVEILLQRDRTNL